MKWTASELKSRSKKAYLVNLSQKPDRDSLTDLTEIHVDVDHVVIGVTNTEPGDLISILRGKCIKKYGFTGELILKNPWKPAKNRDLSV